MINLSDEFWKDGYFDGIDDAGHLVVSRRVLRGRAAEEVQGEDGEEGGGDDRGVEDSLGGGEGDGVEGVVLRGGEVRLHEHLVGGVAVGGEAELADDEEGHDDVQPLLVDGP